MINGQSNKENVMIYMGSDFSFRNAKFLFQEIDTLVTICNNHKMKSNIKCKYSTPS